MTSKRHSDASPDSGTTRALGSDWPRPVLGQHPTGVSVATAIAADGTPVALAVGSLTSDPPGPCLVAPLPRAQSSSWPKTEAPGGPCVTVLAADRGPLCRSFAFKAADKLSGVTWRAATCWFADLGRHGGGGRLRPGDRLGGGRSRHRRRTGPGPRRRAAHVAAAVLSGGHGRLSPRSLPVSDMRFGPPLQLVEPGPPSDGGAV